MRNSRLKMYLAGLFCMVLLAGCEDDVPDPPTYSRDFRGDMKSLIKEIAAFARQTEPKFILMPQNGHELITWDGTLGGYPDVEYIRTVNGFGREDLFYGYIGDDQETPSWVYLDIVFYLQKAMIYKKPVFVTDYCSTPAKIDLSYTKNSNYDFISFQAPSRELDVIPVYPAVPNDVNDADIDSLNLAKNFLYVLQPDAWASREAFIQAVQATNYDLVITDLFFDGEAFTSTEITSLKTKANGGKRLVIAYMSIGEAESYRYYWNNDWLTSAPDWLREENPDWPGNYKVAYWMDGWKQYIFGNAASYTGKVLEAGFDGVYLDIVDAFEYFEALEE